MPDLPISGLDELAGAPADDDLFVVVDVSDQTMAPSGTTKRIKASYAIPRLGYPSFVWNQLTDPDGGYAPMDPITVAGGGTFANLPLDASNDWIVANPEGWPIVNPFGYPVLAVPAGLYSIVWYWETSDGNAGKWDNYMDCYPVASGIAVYPTAPPANPASYWGSAAPVVKLLAATSWISFIVGNRHTGPLDIRNEVVVTRLDA